jgi:hypothetical protein
MAANIYVVDPSIESLEIAKQRYDQTEENGQEIAVSFQTSMEGLPSAIDFAVIATGSGPRADISRALLTAHDVRYLLFEKFLFQKEIEYEEIGELLEKKSVKAWVNCPRRMWPIYQELGKTLDFGTPIHVSIHEGEFGLACNCIHMIDLLAFLDGEDRFHVDLSGLDESPISSKRPGYLEATGLFSARSESGSTLTWVSSRGSQASTALLLSSSRFQARIDESKGTCEIFAPDSGWEGRKVTFVPPFQSQLTNLVASELLTKGSCALTSYESSARMHIPVVRAFSAYFDRAIPGNSGNCPIT